MIHQKILQEERKLSHRERMLKVRRAALESLKNALAEVDIDYEMIPYTDASKVKALFKDLLHRELNENEIKLISDITN